LLVTAGFASVGDLRAAYFLLCWLVQKQDKTSIYHNCPNSAKPPLLAVVSIYSHIHTKYILFILN